jgi:hypothetical protein
MTKVDEAIAELEASFEAAKPEAEGLADFSRLNLEADAMQEVQLAQQRYARRIQLLDTAHAALVALAADGHPDLPVREINAAALQSLRSNSETILAALAKFSSNAAVAIELKAAQPAPKA